MTPTDLVITLAKWTARGMALDAALSIGLVLAGGLDEDPDAVLELITLINSAGPQLFTLEDVQEALRLADVPTPDELEEWLSE